MKKYHIPQPKNTRNIKGSFAWIDHRLVNMKLIAFEGYSVLSPNGYYQVLPIESKAPDYSKQLTDKLFRE